MASVSPQLGMSVRRMLLRGALVFALASGLAACGGGTFQDLGISTSPAAGAASGCGGAGHTGAARRAGCACGRGARRGDAAGLGAGQCRRCGGLDAQRGRNGDRGIPQSQHSTPDQGRRWHAARRAIRRAAGAERRRRDHRRAVVRAIGQRIGAGGAAARHSDDRVFDRRECRRARHLSLELPAGVRRASHRRLRRVARQALVRGDDSRQCLWRGG